MKYIHITDIHLDHLGNRRQSQQALLQENFAIVKQVAIKLVEEMDAANTDVCCLTGDISSGQLIDIHLGIIGSVFESYNKKLLFVLGNHDFYHSSFCSVLDRVREQVSNNPTSLYYLSDKPYHTKEQSFVGHDGWYDGLYAPFGGKSVEMNDYYVIEELREIPSRDLLFASCREKANIAATKTKGDLEYTIASKSPTKVVVLTHVPPFRELSTYKGKISDDMWMPCFSSKQYGDMLLTVANKNPSVSFDILCGHSHGEAMHLALANLRGYTGPAEYGNPLSSLRVRETKQ